MSETAGWRDKDIAELGLYRGSSARLLCPDREDYVQRTIRVSRRFWGQDALAYVLRYAPMRPHVVDVGSYTGSSALWFAMMAGARVTAIEPDTHAYDILRSNVALNGVSGAVRTVHAAVWDRDGLAGAYIRNASNAGAAQFRPCTVFGGDSVPMLRLDTLLSGTDAGVDVLHLSMEGYEYRAVHGARGVISEFHPVIAVTMWPPTGTCSDPGYDCLDAYVSLVQGLAGLGYVLAGTHGDTSVYVPEEVYPWNQ